MKDLWTLAVLCVLAAGSVVPPNETGVEAEEAKTPAVVNADTGVVERIVSSSVTIIYNSKEHEMSMGSGVLYKKGDKWYVMTAAHVVADTDENSYGCGQIIVMFTPMESDSATHAWVGALIAHNSKLDSAIIQIDVADSSGMGAASFAKNAPKVGRDVYSVGNPAGDINTVTEGIICHNHRVVDWCDTRHLQITCNGTHGSSGGGVFTADTGECIGIVVRLNPQSDILMVVPTKEIVAWMHANNLSAIAPY